MMLATAQPFVLPPAPLHAKLPTSVSMGSLWTRTSRLREVWAVVQEIGAWQGIAFAPNQNGLDLLLNRVKLGRLGFNGRLDFLFRPGIAELLVAEGMADRDPTRPGEDQVGVDVRTSADVDRAVSLLRFAYLIL